MTEWPAYIRVSKMSCLIHTVVALLTVARRQDNTKGFKVTPTTHPPIHINEESNRLGTTNTNLCTCIMNRISFVSMYVHMHSPNCFENRVNSFHPIKCTDSINHVRPPPLQHTNCRSNGLLPCLGITSNRGAHSKESRKPRQDRLKLVFQCFSIDYERIPNGVR